MIDIWKKINNTESQVNIINNKLNCISSQQNNYENVIKVLNKQINDTNQINNKQFAAIINKINKLKMI